MIIKSPSKVSNSSDDSKGSVNSAGAHFARSYLKHDEEYVPPEPKISINEQIMRQFRNSCDTANSTLKKSSSEQNKNDIVSSRIHKNNESHTTKMEISNGDLKNASVAA